MTAVGGGRGRLLALAVLVALVGAGCGSGQPADTGAQSGGTQLEGLLDTPIVLGAVKEQRVREGKVVGQFKTGEQYGAVVNRDSPNLDAFNQVITTLKSEGFVDRLLQTYCKDQVSVPVIG
jgi:hypothetical protein